MDLHRCGVCDKTFTEKSNLTRHQKLHGPKEHRCDVCSTDFASKPQMLSHRQRHQYPLILLYKPGEALLKCTPAAKEKAKAAASEVNPTWLNPQLAEAAAKQEGEGGDLWRGQLMVTFGKYAGQSFRWLLENDVGWVVWLLAEYCQKGEANDLLKWQKQRMLEYAQLFPSVTRHVDERLKVKQL